MNTNESSFSSSSYACVVYCLALNKALVLNSMHALASAFVFTCPQSPTHGP